MPTSGIDPGPHRRVNLLRQKEDPGSKSQDSDPGSTWQQLDFGGDFSGCEAISRRFHGSVDGGGIDRKGAHFAQRVGLESGGLDVEQELGPGRPQTQVIKCQYSGFSLKRPAWARLIWSL